MDRAAAQRHRLNRAINFAQAQVSEAIDLDALADVACLSKFHFSRVFRDYCSETPLQFLWRIRLERAARKLVFARDVPVTEIALECGFSCPQTFSRAFRQRFQTPPRLFRNKNIWCYDGLAHDQRANTPIARPALLTDRTGGAHEPVRIEERPSYRVAYVRHIGPYGNTRGGIAAAFGTLRCWAACRGLVDESTALIGLCPDHAAITPPDLCRYDACMPVGDDVEEDGILSIQNIAGGRYAVLSVRPDSPTLHAKWEWFTSRWLPTSGELYDPSLRYEFYPPANGAAGVPETGADLCLRLHTVSPARHAVS